MQKLTTAGTPRVRGEACAALLLLLACLASEGCLSHGAVRVTSEEAFQRALHRKVRFILIDGDITVRNGLVLTGETGPVEIGGTGTLRASPDLSTAVLRLAGAAQVILRDFEIVGNRSAESPKAGLPPWNVSFAQFSKRNGILVEGSSDVRIENVTIRNVPDFAVLVSGGRLIHLEGLKIEDSGGQNERGRNNTTGGILIEEGTSDFLVRGCTLRRLTGNAIWTHSNAGSPRCQRGRIVENRIEDVARDAIQVGHATRIRVENNSGTRIGYPFELVDVETDGTPVALDTAGDVDHTVYLSNTFQDVNGECINLDGFHDGEVRRNVCESAGDFTLYPHAHYGILFGNSDPNVESRNVVIADNRITGTGYGGLFLIGTGHTVTGNRFLMVNRSRCTGDGKIARCNYALEEPDMLRSGLYLARRANRDSVTRDNLIKGNEFQGFGTKRWCITAAPGVRLADNRIEDNTCSDE